MTTIVFGAGLLGQRLARSLPRADLAQGVDITDRASVLAILAKARPSSVVNAAGKTGRPNVDWCEDHPVETMRANVVGAVVLADACAELGIHLVHLGSGCIFYGPSRDPGGWREDDFANPVSFYSRSKFAADLVLSRLPHVAIARLRMPVDAAPGPRNLITKLAGYRYVVDVENSLTIVSDFVDVVGALVERRATGVFHAVNPGPVRHAHLLALYRQFVDPDHRSTLVPEGELVSRGLAKRARSTCVLASARLESLGVRMRPTETALPIVFREYAEALGKGAATGAGPRTGAP